MPGEALHRVFAQARRGAARLAALRHTVSAVAPSHLYKCLIHKDFLK
jgi:hypothetical protein